jgi:hypothetical protein
MFAIGIALGGWLRRTNRDPNGPARSCPRNTQSTLSTHRVTLDPVDSLSGQASLSRNLSDAHGVLSQHLAHLVELLARETWLPAKIGSFVILFRMLDTGPLCSLDGLSLGLRGRSHEGDQRVTDGSLHGITSRAIEREAVDTVRMTTPLRMNSRMVSHTSS